MRPRTGPHSLERPVESGVTGQRPQTDEGPMRAAGWSLRLALGGRGTEAKPAPAPVSGASSSSQGDCHQPLMGIDTALGSRFC